MIHTTKLTKLEDKNKAVTKEYCTIPLMWETQRSKNHGDRKYNGGFQGSERVREGEGSFNVKEFQSGKMKSSGNGWWW